VRMTAGSRQADLRNTANRTLPALLAELVAAVLFGGFVLAGVAYHVYRMVDIPAGYVNRFVDNLRGIIWKVSAKGFAREVRLWAFG
jgi:hypothetical protein